MNAQRHGSISMPSPRLALRAAAALALLIGGLVHLQLYFAAYRRFPDANLGRSFLLNVITSGIVAAALIVRSERVVAATGILVAGGTVAAFAITRSSDALFGFQENGLQPSPQAVIALAAEITATILLAATFVPTVAGAHDNSASAGPALVVPTVAVVAVALIGMAGYWSHHYDTGRESAGQQPSGTTPTAISATSAPTTILPTTTRSAPGASTSAPLREGVATTTTIVATPTTAATTAAPAAAVAMVSIVDFAFDAATLNVPVGASVTWTNVDPFDHSVVANDGSYVSDTLGTDTTFQHTFQAAGEYTYQCGIHPSMTGTIIVE